jgi:hypothetical protein
VSQSATEFLTSSRAAVDGVVADLLLAWLLFGVALERGADELDMEVDQMLDAASSWRPLSTRNGRPAPTHCGH